MKIKALVTVLGMVLGSSVAMADSSASVSAQASWSVRADGYYTRDHRAPAQPIVRDHRAPRTPVVVHQQWRNPRVRQPIDTSWRTPSQPSAMLFADGLTFSIKGTRQDIVVGADKGTFRSINISGAGGRTYITHARIDFMDGSYQVTRGLDRTLAGSQSMSLDLDGNVRQIKRIVVYGETNGAFLVAGIR